MPAKRTLTSLLTAAALVLPAAPGRADEPPRLVLLIAVDQLRRDRLDAALPGGLGRLAREGRVYAEAALDHAGTATCPGHVTMLTGRHPGPAGVPGNEFIDRATGRTVYCVEDPAEDARVLGGEGGRSPRNIRVEALGDWLKAARPGTRVFAVSGKDRAAIAMAGRRPDAAYWLARGGSPGFTTSRYYREALPAWVEAFNGSDPPHDGFWAGLPERWVHADGIGGERGRPDDYPAESGELGRTSGHPVRSGALEEAATRLHSSPWADSVTLDFARELVRREGLGTRGQADLLAVGLSGTDRIGHLWGPESHEARDALLRLDAELGDFLGFLEGVVGPGRLLVALTADHGVLPLPEWLAETGRSECPVDGGRLGLRMLVLRLLWETHLSLSPTFSIPVRWLSFAGANLTVDRKLALQRGVAVGEVVAVAKRYLEAQPGIARVWTAQDILAGEDPLARLYRNSYDPQRSGDAVVQVERTCLISAYDSGTSHGSPYGYDRDVPLVFFGPGVPKGAVPGPAATVDIAPTLAVLLGLEPPGGLDGRPLLPAPRRPGGEP